MLMILCPLALPQHQQDGLPLEAASWHGISGGMPHGGGPVAQGCYDTISSFWRHLGPLNVALCLMQHIFDLGIKRTAAPAGSLPALRLGQSATRPPAMAFLATLGVFGFLGAPVRACSPCTDFPWPRALYALSLAACSAF